MPVKLTHPERHPMYGLRVDRTVIAAMVGAYRVKHAADPKCLKFIHFSLDEVISLFIANGYIDGTVPINGQLRGLQYIGLKIYLGTHTDPSNCPQDPNADPTKPNPYLALDTAIVCNTQLNPKNKTWEDQLSDTPAVENSISIIGVGAGIDRGAICPPNCPPTPDADGFSHQDIYP